MEAIPEETEKDHDNETEDQSTFEEECEGVKYFNKVKFLNQERLREFYYDKF